MSTLITVRNPSTVHPGVVYLHVNRTPDTNSVLSGSKTTLHVKNTGTAFISTYIYALSIFLNYIFLLVFYFSTFDRIVLLLNATIRKRTG